MAHGFSGLQNDWNNFDFLLPHPKGFQKLPDRGSSIADNASALSLEIHLHKDAKKTAFESHYVLHKSRKDFFISPDEDVSG